MKPNRLLAEIKTPDGGRLMLYEHDGNFIIRINGQELMNSKVATSELLLGELAVRRISNQTPPAVLIGGLGLGFTLKGALKQLSSAARVEVAELIPDIVKWNREFLSSINGPLLEDPRVKVLIDDVWNVINGAAVACYDAIVLDIDNGPTAMVQKTNTRLYNRPGLEKIARALKPGGRAAFWSARPDQGFSHQLRKVGFTVEVVPAKLYANAKRAAYTIYLADI